MIITCEGCGKSVVGRKNQKYCPDCSLSRRQDYVRRWWKELSIQAAEQNKSLHVWRRERKRYAAYTFKTQIKTLGIPKGGRDMANGAQLAALTLGEKNSAQILNHALETGGSYLQAETTAIDLFRQLRHLADGQYSKFQLKERL